MYEKTTEVLPSARRLMESMRSMGYGFENAVADIIDNSIQAGAVKIVIEAKFSGQDSYFLISDNGRGMNPNELEEAMRFGSESDYSPSSLGKFGLGLKTSSLSQCSCFYVASRSEHENSGVHTVVWDCEHVKNANRWEILHPGKDETYSQLCKRSLERMHGTTVLWTQLDTLFRNYKDPDGKSAEKRFNSTCRDTENHLAMVFHRFLSGECGKLLKINFNGNLVQPWDPFALDYRGRGSDAYTWKESERNFEVVPGMSEVACESFVLPSKKEFSSQKDFDRYAGPKKWNRQQGFYIYRAERMIQSGGWSGMRVPDEHTKLARVSLRFSPDLDDVFEINVQKMKVSLHSKLKENLESVIQSLIRSAKSRYKGEKPPLPLPPRPPREPKYTIREIRDMLAAVSDSEELSVLNRVFGRVFPN